MSKLVLDFSVVLLKTIISLLLNMMIWLVVVPVFVETIRFQLLNMMI